MNGDIRFIAVVGGSGSGKSWLARELTGCLGNGAAHVCLDDFYHDLGHLPAAEREGVNFDDPAAIDWDTLREVIDTLACGGTACVPVYDFVTHARTGETVELASRPIIVLDGLWLLHPEWLRNRISLSLFVDCPEELRLSRRMERDRISRGRTEESVRRQFTGHVQPMHVRFVEPQRKWATACVSPPLPKEELERLLAACRG